MFTEQSDGEFEGRATYALAMHPVVRDSYLYTQYLIRIGPALGHASIHPDVRVLISHSRGRLVQTFSFKSQEKKSPEMRLRTEN